MLARFTGKGIYKITLPGTYLHKCIFQNIYYVMSVALENPSNNIIIAVYPYIYFLKLQSIFGKVMFTHAFNTAMEMCCVPGTAILNVK